MRKTLLCILAASAFYAAPALAQNPNGDIPGCVPSEQSPQKCDGDVNNGGQGGNGGIGVGVGVGVGVAEANANAESTAVAGAIATGGNATASGGNATASTGAITNTNTATGGAGGNATSNSGGNSLINETNYKRAHRIAPPAYAPFVMVGQCQKSLSGGISTPFGGVSLGGSSGDKFCQMQALANWFATNGRLDVACRILYNNDRRVSQALTDSGVGCPAYEPPVVVAPLPSTPPVPPRQPENG
jgi:hypothetical protein